MSERQRQRERERERELAFKVQTGATKPSGHKFAMQLSNSIYLLDTDELVTLNDDCHGSK